MKRLKRFSQDEFVTGQLRFTDVAATANDQPLAILMQKSKDNTTIPYRLTYILAAAVAIF